MSISRRDFLSAGATSAAVIATTTQVPHFLLEAAAAPGAAPYDRVLVVIQLTGGNDGLNTIVPYGDDQYHRNRFETRIRAADALPIDDYVGFHPRLRGLAQLLEAQQLAIVQGVGYPHPNRSHFESMDIWHTAMQAQGTRVSGWLGRYLDDQAGVAADAHVPAVHFGSRSQPLALAGLNVHVPSIDSIDGFRLRGLETRKLRERVQRATDAPRELADGLLGFLKSASQAALAASREVQQAVTDYSTPVDYPATDLANQLRSVAQLVDAGLATRIYYVTLDGFDTHSQQAEAHAALLGELGDALSAFLGDLSHHGHAERTAVLVFSEFGRRVKENASRGTDHGAAAPMFLAGGGVRGGVIGSHPSLTDLDDGDLRFHTDFRQVYATVLEEWLGAASQGVLQGKFDKLRLFA
jgi:uncharacterized protein (DUF1501 family)